MDQSRGITSQFSTVGAGSFIIDTPNPSRDSALLDCGLNAALNGQVSVFGDYLVQAGQSNYFGQSVRLASRSASKVCVGYLRNASELAPRFFLA